MKLAEYFAQAYRKHENDDRIRAKKGTFEHFRIACKYLCGGNTSKGLLAFGVSNEEIKRGIENKIIRYEPCMGITRRESGYVLTSKGVREVFKTITAGIRGERRNRK